MEYYWLVLTTVFIITLAIVMKLKLKHRVMNKDKSNIEDIWSKSPYRNNNTKPQHHQKNDKLLRDKQKEELTEELTNSLSTEEVVVQKLQNNQEKTLELDKKIVGIAKPKGFWSNLIMSQKLGYIIARMNIENGNNSQGFWVNLIKAQEISQGKEKNRGR